VKGLRKVKLCLTNEYAATRQVLEFIESELELENKMEPRSSSDIGSLPLKLLNVSLHSHLFLFRVRLAYYPFLASILASELNSLQYSCHVGS
jgi:hypothetical protein